MSTLTVTIDDASLDRLAEAIARRLPAGSSSASASAPPPPEPTESDPWDAPWPAQAPSGQDGSASRSAPSSGQSAPQAPTTPAAPPVQTGTITVNAKNGPQQWTLGASNAPACKHSQPAAYVQGFTNGKPWKMWRCALGAGDGWRDKCDFSQWA